MTITHHSHNNTVQIESYNFLEFIQEMYEAVAIGYKPNFTDNDKVPGNYGNFYYATLEKDNDVVVEEQKQEDNEAKPKRTRKKVVKQEED